MSPHCQSHMKCQTLDCNADRLKIAGWDVGQFAPFVASWRANNSSVSSACEFLGQFGLRCSMISANRTMSTRGSTFQCATAALDLFTPTPLHAVSASINTSIHFIDPAQICSKADSPVTSRTCKDRAPGSPCQSN